MPGNRHIILIRSTYTASGGVERVSLGLIRGLLAKGCVVTLLTMPHQDWPVAHQRLSIVEMGFFRTHRLIQAWSFNRAVIRFLSRQKADAILSLDKVTLFTHLHAGGGTHKTFLKIKNQYSSGLSRWLRSMSIFHRYILNLEKRGFSNPMLKKVRCNSELVKKDIVRDYNVAEEKLVLVHSGIRWDDMEATFDRRTEIGNELLELHRFDPEWKMILFLGSGFARKGLDIALQGLAAMHKDYHLIVVGKGRPKRFRIMAQALGITKRIHYIGPQENGWRYAAACKALVLPSYYDPFGGAAAEGHAMGLPVLVSDKTGYADRVVHGENGVILKTPFESIAVKAAFAELEALIEAPKWSPVQIRQHARYVADDVVLSRLLEQFL